MHVAEGTCCFLCLDAFEEGDAVSCCALCASRSNSGTSLFWHNACTKGWKTPLCPYCKEPLKAMHWARANKQALERCLEAAIWILFYSFCFKQYFSVLVTQCRTFHRAYFEWYSHCTPLGVCYSFLTAYIFSFVVLWVQRQRLPTLYYIFHPFSMMGITMGIPYILIEMDCFRGAMCMCLFRGFLHCCVTEFVPFCKRCGNEAVDLWNLRWRSGANPNVRTAAVVTVITV
jgi:hypothetical protein